jgi:hypothetical protein
MAPFGSLATGVLAHRFGAPTTVLAGGALTIAAVALFARKLPDLRREVRPIYQRMGILPVDPDNLPEVESGHGLGGP